MIEPRYRDSGVAIYLGEVRAVLAELEAESVDAIITSPPYFSLRDYGLPPTAWGGDPDHEHVWAAPQQLPRRRGRDGDRALHGTSPSSRSACPCGAWLGQLGLEPDPAMFVDHLVEVFRAARRVLKREGTLWLNLGDSYASKTRRSDAGWDKSRLTNPGYSQKAQSASLRSTGERHRGKSAGFKAKDRMLIPARVAMALSEDGWYLRDEIVWAKTNPMPSSVEDRTTPAHEMVYLLSRSGDPTYWIHRDGDRVTRRPTADYRWIDQRRAQYWEEVDEPEDWRTERLDDGARRWHRVNLWKGHDYFYDGDAIREGATSREIVRLVDSVPVDPSATSPGDPPQSGLHRRAAGATETYSDGRVPRGWANGEGRGHNPLVGRYQPARRATPNEEGTAAASASGGDRWTGLNDRWREGHAPRDHGEGRLPPDEAGRDGTRNKRSVWSLATEPYPEAHYATFPTALIEPMILAGVPAGGIVLDPFAGSGTVGLVAKRLGRRAVLIDFGEEYVEQAIRRTSHEFGVGGRRLVDDGTAEPAADGLWAVAK